MLKLRGLSDFVQNLFIVPQSKTAQFIFAFVAEFALFFILVANTRAIMKGTYFWIAITETLIGTQGFVLGRLSITKDEFRSWPFGLGSIVGGTCGSLFSVFITKHLYGA